MNRLYTFSRVVAFVCALSFAVPTLPAQASLMSRVKNYFSPAATQNVTDFLHKHRWALAAGAFAFTCSAVYAFMKLRTRTSQMPNQPQYAPISQDQATQATSYRLQSQKEADQERTQRKQIVETILNKLNQLNDKKSQFVGAAECLRDIALKVDRQRKDNQLNLISSITNKDLEQALLQALEKVIAWGERAKCVTKRDLVTGCITLKNALTCNGKTDLLRNEEVTWQNALKTVDTKVETLVQGRQADLEANRQ